MVYHHVFCEPRKGFVAHTAASRILAEDPKIQDVVGVMCEETWPAYARVCSRSQSSPS